MIEPLTKKKVMIVDDEKNLTLILTMLLETRGYDVVVANTGLEALRKATSLTDLIILDLTLPDIHGLEVCRRLKENHGTREIPVIILSAHHKLQNRIEGLHLGADDFLAKPCDHEELFARMEAVMRRSHSLIFPDEFSAKESIILELKQIIEQERIVPFFQPIFLLKPISFFGFEVLCRPQTKTSLSNPDVFFKLALQYGCYHEVEMMTWTKAIEAVASVIGDKHLFLNCNPYLIEGAKFIEVKSILENSGVPIKNVVIEITERSVITDFKLFFEQLYKYRQLGFRFAIDDVGGGYASLESIVETKPEIVKIDRHIVKDVVKDSYKKSIIKFIVNFCKENHILTVAEGIENYETLKLLTDMGVDAGQGYFLYKPTSKINLSEINQVYKIIS